MVGRRRHPVRAVQPNLRQAKSVPANRRNYRMGKLLVVDDDEALRGLMRLELGDAYEIIDSGEPELGLALALEHRPEAILLDLRMPNYSGYELLQAFTSLSRTQTIPVIIVSGGGGDQTTLPRSQLRPRADSKNRFTFRPDARAPRQPAQPHETPLPHSGPVGRAVP